MLHCSEPGFILESLNSEVIARYNCFKPEVAITCTMNYTDTNVFTQDWVIKKCF